MFLIIHASTIIAFMTNEVPTADRRVFEKYPGGSGCVKRLAVVDRSVLKLPISRFDKHISIPVPTASHFIFLHVIPKILNRVRGCHLTLIVPVFFFHNYLLSREI